MPLNNQNSFRNLSSFLSFHLHVHAPRRSFASYFFLSTCLSCFNFFFFSVYLGSGIAGTLQPPPRGRDIILVVCTSRSRLCLFYDSSVMPHLPPCSLPSSLFFSVFPSPSHMYFYQSSTVSSTCHCHSAVCLYPCMCIPYSISRCSLTLYGALAGHRRPCQSSFIRFCYVIIG